jgi:hypothetical protein
MVIRLCTVEDGGIIALVKESALCAADDISCSQRVARDAFPSSSGVGRQGGFCLVPRGLEITHDFRSALWIGVWAGLGGMAAVPSAVQCEDDLVQIGLVGVV